MSRGAGIARALGSWLPVLGVYLAILLTLPFGTLIAHSLYRLGTDTVTTRVALPDVATEIVALSAGRVVRLERGGLAFFDGPEARGVPDLPGECAELGFFRGSGRIVCPLGCEGVAMLRGDELGHLRADFVEVGGEATTGHAVGTQTVVGTADGRLVFLDRDEIGTSLEIGSSPVVRARIFGGFIAALIDQDLVLVERWPGEEAREIARLALGAPGFDLDRGSDHHLALTADEVVLLDLSSPSSPRIVRRVATPAPARRLKVALPSVIYVVTDADGAHILRNTEAGPVWWEGARAPELATATACGGGWGGLLCAGPGPDGPELRAFTILPTQRSVVAAVGVIGGGLMLGLLGFFVFTRPPEWPVRLVWLGIGLTALAAQLASSLHSPTEALHVLEYGALGVLLYRAVAREIGAGAAAAGLALLIGLGGGLLDETIQHLHPRRTGAISDVFLDGRAIAIGVGIGWLALRLGWGRPPVSWSWPLGAVAALLLGLLGLQHASVGFGYAHEHEELRWTSALSAAELQARNGDPAAREALRRGAAIDYSEFLRQNRADPYLVELRVRLYRRDMRRLRGDLPVACAEARIIDRVFGETVQGTGFSWDEANRAACEELAQRREPVVYGEGSGASASGIEAARGTPTYVSPVGEGRITWVPGWLAWLLTALASGGLLGLAVLVGRRQG